MLFEFEIAGETMNENYFDNSGDDLVDGTRRIFEILVEYGYVSYRLDSHANILSDDKKNIHHPKFVDSLVIHGTLYRLYSSYEYRRRLTGGNAKWKVAREPLDERLKSARETLQAMEMKMQDVSTGIAEVIELHNSFLREMGIDPTDRTALLPNYDKETGDQDFIKAEELPSRWREASMHFKWEDLEYHYNDTLHDQGAIQFMGQEDFKSPRIWEKYDPMFPVPQKGRRPDAALSHAVKRMISEGIESSAAIFHLVSLVHRHFEELPIDKELRDSIRTTYMK
jgi:hypothetical protein